MIDLIVIWRCTFFGWCLGICSSYFCTERKDTDRNEFITTLADLKSPASVKLSFFISYFALVLCSESSTYIGQRWVLLCDVRKLEEIEISIWFPVAFLEMFARIQITTKKCQPFACSSVSISRKILFLTNTVTTNAFPIFTLRQGDLRKKGFNRVYVWYQLVFVPVALERSILPRVFARS